MTIPFLDLARQLPCYPELTDAELDGVVSAVRTAVGRREPTPLTRGS
jgi:hypothetical protein